MSRFSVPTHLDHKPILVIPDYNEMDGPYHPDTTDAQHLSLGVSQWSSEELSLKVFRHSGNRWSRQSEELPPHRAIDLVSLLTVAYGYYKSGVPKKKTTIQHNGFSMEVEMMPEGLDLYETFISYFNKNDALIAERLRALYHALEQLKQSGAI
ncbi:MAG: DUF6530 family protein [Alicyclobacillus sp.]|nr:DUF6530 family protein [Alicyclobacillus sp.]